MSQTHMRSLKGSNLIPFVRVQFARLNFSALFKSQFRRPEVEDEDLSEYLRSIYKCHCVLCRLHVHREDKRAGALTVDDAVAGDATEDDTKAANSTCRTQKHIMKMHMMHINDSPCQNPRNKAIPSASH